MMVLRCSSYAKNMHELVAAAEGLGFALLLSPSAVKTEKELEFAYYLANEAFAAGSNISAKLSNETMLYLSCETNFSSALRKMGAADPSDFMVVSEVKIPLAKLKKALKLSRAQEVRLSQWGKMKGYYFEGELAVERMALARIRN